MPSVFVPSAIVFVTSKTLWTRFPPAIDLVSVMIRLAILMSSTRIWDI